MWNEQARVLENERRRHADVFSEGCDAGGRPDDGSNRHVSNRGRMVWIARCARGARAHLRSHPQQPPEHHNPLLFWILRESLQLQFAGPHFPAAEVRRAAQWMLALALQLLVLDLLMRLAV